MVEPENRLLNVTEVAEYFRVTPESVRRWLRDGKLLGIDLGGGSGWRVRVCDLQLFINGRQMRKSELLRDVGRNGGLRKAN